MTTLETFFPCIDSQRGSCHFKKTCVVHNLVEDLKTDNFFKIADHDLNYKFLQAVHAKRSAAICKRRNYVLRKYLIDLYYLRSDFFAADRHGVTLAYSIENFYNRCMNCGKQFRVPNNRSRPCTYCGWRFLRRIHVSRLTTTNGWPHHLTRHQTSSLRRAPPFEIWQVIEIITGPRTEWIRIGPIAIGTLLYRDVRATVIKNMDYSQGGQTRFKMCNIPTVPFDAFKPYVSDVYCFFNYGPFPAILNVSLWRPLHNMFECPLLLDQAHETIAQRLGYKSCRHIVEQSIADQNRVERQPEPLSKIVIEELIRFMLAHNILNPLIYVSWVVENTALSWPNCPLHYIAPLIANDTNVYNLFFNVMQVNLSKYEKKVRFHVTEAVTPTYHLMRIEDEPPPPSKRNKY